MSPYSPSDTPPVLSVESQPLAPSEPPSAQAEPEAIDLVRLAEKLLALLKQELHVERERGHPHRLR